MELISSKNVLNIICHTLNRVDPRLMDHGQRVGYMVLKMMECEGGYSRAQTADWFMTAALHDIGAYKTEEIDNMVSFETGPVWNHSIYGYLFLRCMSPLAPLADAILFHHLSYESFKNVKCENPRLAQMIFLTDRTDILMQVGHGVIDGNLFSCQRDKRFSGELMDLLIRAEQQFQITARLADRSYIDELSGLTDEMEFSAGDINRYIQMLGYAIDFRSECTVTHTITTVSISAEIARYMKLSHDDRRNIYYGAMMHDLGKISIPAEILEYPGRLSPQAMKIMQSHVVVTGEIIRGYIDPEICEIAVRHHEKLDGTGYPLGLRGEELTPAQRIVAVADIVSALCGKRSYKDSFDRNTIFSVLQEMSDKGKICPRITRIMLENYDGIIKQADRRSRNVLNQYANIWKSYEDLLNVYEIPHEDTAYN